MHIENRIRIVIWLIGIPTAITVFGLWWPILTAIGFAAIFAAAFVFVLWLSGVINFSDL